MVKIVIMWSISLDENNNIGLVYNKHNKDGVLRGQYKVGIFMQPCSHFVFVSICGVAYKILLLKASACREGSDKPAHKFSLARAFTFGIHKVGKKRQTQNKN